MNESHSHRIVLFPWHEKQDYISIWRLNDTEVICQWMLKPLKLQLSGQQCNDGGLSWTSAGFKVIIHAACTYLGSK